MAKVYKDSQMEILIKECIKMENHLDMDNIIGFQVASLKEIFYKD